MIKFPGNRAFCDTSFFFASLYPKDVNYEKAGQFLKEALAQEITLYTTWDILSEKGVKSALASPLTELTNRLRMSLAGNGGCRSGR